jgi:hypothetical protein
MSAAFGIGSLEIKPLLREELTAPEKEGSPIQPAIPQDEDRDEYAALEAAATDLARLSRYECRAWSRQKRALRAFVNIKFMRNLSSV